MGHGKSKLVNESEPEQVFTRLIPRQIEYICQQTNLIDKEVCRRHAQFLKIYPDGRVTEEQLAVKLQEIWPMGNVQKFASYLFDLFDKDRKGFINFTQFILITHRLNDGKSFLGLLFDMSDINRKGFLKRKKVESLVTSLYELTGRPKEDHSGEHAPQRQIAHLLRIIDARKDKRLFRDAFLNMDGAKWIDDEYGIGILLVEYSC